MFNFKKYFILAAIFFASLPSMALVQYRMTSLEIGTKYSGLKNDLATNSEQTTGLQFGFSTLIDLDKPEKATETASFSLRTGLIYSVLNSNNSSSANDYEAQFSYAQIPFQFVLNFESYAGLYVGPSLNFLISNSSNVKPTATKISQSLDGDEAETMVAAFTVGGFSKISETFGLNIFFETMPSNLSSNYKNANSFGAQLMMTFE